MTTQYKPGDKVRRVACPYGRIEEDGRRSNDLGSVATLVKPDLGSEDGEGYWMVLTEDDPQEEHRWWIDYFEPVIPSPEQKLQRGDRVIFKSHGGIHEVESVQRSNGVAAINFGKADHPIPGSIGCPWVALSLLTKVKPDMTLRRRFIEQDYAATAVTELVSIAAEGFDAVRAELSEDKLTAGMALDRLRSALFGEP